MTNKLTDFKTYAKKRIPELIICSLCLFSWIAFMGGINEPWFTSMSRTMQLIIAVVPGLLAVIFIVALEIHDNIQQLRKIAQQTKTKVADSLKKITLKQILFYICTIISIIIAGKLTKIFAINVITFLLRFFTLE